MLCCFAGVSLCCLTCFTALQQISIVLEPNSCPLFVLGQCNFLCFFRIILFMIVSCFVFHDGFKYLLFITFVCLFVFICLLLPICLSVCLFVCLTYSRHDCNLSMSWGGETTVWTLQTTSENKTGLPLPRLTQSFTRDG